MFFINWKITSKQAVSGYPLLLASMVFKVLDKKFASLANKSAAGNGIKICQMKN